MRFHVLLVRIGLRVRAHAFPALRAFQIRRD